MDEDYWSILAHRTSGKINDDEWAELIKDSAFVPWLKKRGYEFEGGV